LKWSNRETGLQKEKKKEIKAHELSKAIGMDVGGCVLGV